jgi:hypothetical protein
MESRFHDKVSFLDETFHAQRRSHLNPISVYRESDKQPFVDVTRCKVSAALTKERERLELLSHVQQQSNAGMRTLRAAEGKQKSLELQRL